MLEWCSPRWSGRASQSAHSRRSTASIRKRLYLWRRRFAAVAEGDNTTFREVIVRPSLEVRHGEEARFEIVLSSGVVVRVPPSFDAATLTRLLDVLLQARGR